MLEQKLCEELRKNGYPQNSHTLYGSGRYYLTLPINKSNGDKTYEPNLSELIEACGYETKNEPWGDGKFEFCLQRYEDEWGAGYKDPNYHESWDELITGSTPEEAVAKLWLELNKKD